MQLSRSVQRSRAAATVINVAVPHAGGIVRIICAWHKLFECCGLRGIGRGRVPLRIQVLAPNHRPIQITNDLETFWRDGYPKIKKELQRKYPKHQWR